MIDYLKKHSIVPVVNLSQPLREAKEKARKEHTKTALPLYYRTDFHWTYYGAYIAYRAIVEEINDSYPQYLIHPTPLSDFSIKSRPDWVHIGFIYALGLNPVHHKNETYLTFHPKANTPLHSLADFGAKGIDDYSLPALVKNNYSGHVIASRELLNKSGKLKTLFVIGDSFSEKYFGFFAAHAKKTVNFRTVYSFFTAPYEKYHPDIVIQEVLNMYLLQPPPSNPPTVREARENALAGATPIVEIEPGG